MQKLKRFLAKVMVVICLSAVISPEATAITNTPAITAQAATYSKSTIKQVQQKLSNAGYACRKLDGIAGKSTRAAIKKYQRNNGLKVTGTVNKTLLKALNIKGKSTSSNKKETIVYVTETGTKYHRANCRYLWHSKISMKLSEAKKYYEPCSVCKP